MYQLGSYLESYIESVSTLPSELKRNFTLIRELDARSKGTATTTTRGGPHTHSILRAHQLKVALVFVGPRNPHRDTRANRAQLQEVPRQGPTTGQDQERCRRRRRRQQHRPRPCCGSKGLCYVFRVCRRESGTRYADLRDGMRH